MSVEGWTPVPTADGSATLRSEALGEACHDLAGAWTEARERYTVPALLPLLAARSAPLRLLDVGTGLGWNLAAALDEATRAGVELDVVSLEIDRRVIEGALELAAAGRLARGDPARAHAPVAQALSLALAAGGHGPGRSVPLGRGRLRVYLGDARETLAGLPREERFDAVFLDPFSPRADPAAWAGPFLREVASRMEPRARLATYTASFEVRLRLAAAGLAVGRGPRVGRKAEGTVAGRGIEVEPLHPRTARRLERRLRELAEGRSSPAG